MPRWNKEGIPHKGWKYVDVIDLGEGLLPGEQIEYESCEMCGQERIRYVHILSHPDVEDAIHVGCDCAAQMLNDYVNPTERERNLRNKLKRRENFMRREWTRKDNTGNYTLRYKGENITIVKSKYGSWGVVFREEWCWKYRGEKIHDINTAKLVAFELFDELYE
ncbi:MAG: hypothetical protein J6A41_01185 [Ruminiclostridium sp.]|nr:hypothetical protein [Ruminiclostridium sp.]